MRDGITGLILAYNEKENIGRTLESLRWLPRVVVVDSFSTDETVEIARLFANVEVVQRQFDTHATQWNFGLEQVRTEWVLTLDADYILSDELISDIRELSLSEDVNGYSAAFEYWVAGKRLRGTILPPRTVLFRKSAGRYLDDGHTQALQLDGRAEQLQEKIYHDDRKPLTRWMQSQISYARIEAAHLEATPSRQLRPQDRLRKLIVPAPWMVFFYTLFGKRVILDGWRGWFYAVQRLVAELLLSMFLLERKLDT